MSDSPTFGAGTPGFGKRRLPRWIVEQLTNPNCDLVIIDPKEEAVSETMGDAILRARLVADPRLADLSAAQLDAVVEFVRVFEKGTAVALLTGLQLRAHCLDDETMLLEALAAFDPEGDS